MNVSFKHEEKSDGTVDSYWWQKQLYFTLQLQGMVKALDFREPRWSGVKCVVPCGGHLVFFLLYLAFITVSCAFVRWIIKIQHNWLL